MDALEILNKFGIELEKARLVKGGTELQACCPFHQEKEPSFYLNVESLVYKCFGCEASGYIYDIIVEYTNLTRDEVRQALKGDIPKHYEKRKPKRINGRYLSDVEIDVLTQYISGFHTLLVNEHGLNLPGLKDVSQWQKYLMESRGLSLEAIKFFRLGANSLPRYNQYFIDHTRTHYKRINLREILSDLNLVNRRGGDYWYSDSPVVIIPYFYDGQCYYVNARVLHGNKSNLRYINISGIAREMLFNEDALDNYDSIYLVEGEFNAMKLWDAGFQNVVSFGSKGNIPKYADKLYGKDVILYVDNDVSDPEWEVRTTGINALLECAKSVGYFELSQGVDINDYLISYPVEQFENEVLSNIIHVDSNEFLPGEYSELPESERKQVITLAEAQKRNAEFMNQIGENLPAYSGKKILDNMPIGTAKTTGAISLIKQRNDDPTLVMTSTHYLATDYDNAIDFQNGRFTVHLKGRRHKDIECPYAGESDFWASRGYGLYFKLSYCMGRCEKKNDCEHINLLNSARHASVLIATHAHGQLKEFFTSPYWGNNKRNLIVIDEEAELVKSVYLSMDVIQYNIRILEKARDILIAGGNGYLTRGQTAGIAADSLIMMLKDMELSRIGRRGYVPDLKPYTKQEIYTIDKCLCMDVRESGANWRKRNLLHDLTYVINNRIEFKYDQRRDSLYYIWRAVFPKRACVLFLTGTTPKEYIEKSLNIQIDEVIGQQFYVKRDNLEVVQLLNVTGGRQRLLYDKKLQANILEFFRLALEKHRDKKMILITSQGAGTDPDDTAKNKVIGLLWNTAREFNRNLIGIETSELETGRLNLGLNDIPVIHYGIQGTNLFADYEVLIELNAHYYNQQTIIDGVQRCFDVDVSDREPVKRLESFKTLDKQYSVEKYAYGVGEVDLYIEANQKADIIQAEGRILRGQDTPKIVYRLHNVNIEPYPDRLYKSWDTMLKGEFGIVKTTGKLADVRDWIQENVKTGDEFTTRQIVDGLGGYVNDINKRYLKKLVESGDIINLVSGHNILTKWKRLK